MDKSVHNKHQRQATRYQETNTKLTSKQGTIPDKNFKPTTI
jgi:hypothetical protein